ENQKRQDRHGAQADALRQAHLLLDGREVGERSEFPAPPRTAHRNQDADGNGTWRHETPPEGTLRFGPSQKCESRGRQFDCNSFRRRAKKKMESAKAKSKGRLTKHE